MALALKNTNPSHFLIHNLPEFDNELEWATLTEVIPSLGMYYIDILVISNPEAHTNETEMKKWRLW